MYLTRSFVLNLFLNFSVVLCFSHCVIYDSFFSNERKLCPYYPANCKAVRSCFFQRILFQGTVKNVSLCTLHNETLVLSRLTYSCYRNDFLSNIEAHNELGDTRYSVPIIAYCHDEVLTPFYPHGSLKNFHIILGDQWSLHDSLSFRFLVCMQYVRIIAYLHSYDRVMCDSSDLDKTLQQYLLSDDQLILINDLDAAPRLDSRRKAVCGKRILDGAFVAPEQRGEFAISKGYDEKTDIWKVPDVTLWILGSYADDMKFSLFTVHKKCKSENPNDRPSALEVLREYRLISETLK